MVNSSALLKTSGSYTINLIRAGKSRNFEFSLKALPISVLIILISLSGAAADNPNDGRITWEQPFSPSSTDMPQHYGSGSSIPFRVDVSNIGSSPGDIKWYRKKAGDTSWTEVEGENIRSDWGHGETTSDEAYPASTFFINDENTGVSTLNENEQTTFTVDGDEITVEATTICPDSCTPSKTGITVGNDLISIKEGGYFEASNSVLRVTDIESDDVGNEYIDITHYTEDRTPSDGNYEYKVEVETDSNEFYHTDSIYFDLGSSDGNNIPYISEVRISNKTTYSFLPAANIQEGAVVAVDIAEQESDSFNLILEDRNNAQDLQRHTYDGDVEEFTGDSVYSELLDKTLGNFIDVSEWQVQSKNTAVFKLSKNELDQTNFLSSKGNTYSLGFKIEEEASNLVRNSVDYSTPVEATNDAPTIDTVGFQDTCYDGNFQSVSQLSGGDLVDCLVVDVSDPDNEGDHIVKVNFTQVYDDRKVVRDTSFSTPSDNFGNTYYFAGNGFNTDVNPQGSTLTEDKKVLDSGTWKAEVTVEDGLNSVSKTVTSDIPWGSLNVEMVQPSKNFSILSNSSFGMDLRLTCSGGPECVNQNESTSVYWDPVKTGSTSARWLP